MLYYIVLDGLHQCKVTFRDSRWRVIIIICMGNQIVTSNITGRFQGCFVQNQITSGIEPLGEENLFDFGQDRREIIL